MVTYPWGRLTAVQPGFGCAPYYWQVHRRWDPCAAAGPARTSMNRQDHPLGDARDTDLMSELM